MHNKSLSILALAAALFVASPASALPQAITWNAAKATANGSGCNAFDTMFIDAGDQITVVFANLGVELTGTWDDARVALSACSIVIPATVKKGWYLAELNQTMFYGYRRTDGTRGKVSFFARFFNYYVGGVWRG